MSAIPEIWFDGHPRKLAVKPPPADFGGLRKFGAAVRTIPRAQWFDIDRRVVFPWWRDQNGYSSCTGSVSDALRRARLLAGMPDHELSRSFVYAQINGDRDEGASITDAVKTLLTTGTCLASEVGEDLIYRRQIPQSAYQTAKRFRASAAYHCATFDELMSAVLLGYVVVFGIRVDNDFPKLDADGVPPVHKGYGNHCLIADGLRKLPSGRSGLDTDNSWGPKYGDKGRMYLVEEHFTSEPDADAYAIEAATDDPLGPNPPPAVV